MNIRVFVACGLSLVLASGCSSEGEDTSTADSGPSSGTDTASPGTDAASFGADADATDASGSDRGALVQEYSNACLTACTEVAACDSTEYPLAECEDDCTTTAGELVSELDDSAEADACVNALIALEVCIGGLNCAEVDEYFNETIENYPCLVEDTAAVTSCSQFGE